MFLITKKTLDYFIDRLATVIALKIEGLRLETEIQEAKRRLEARASYEFNESAKKRAEALARQGEAQVIRIPISMSEMITKAHDAAKAAELKAGQAASFKGEPKPLRRKSTPKRNYESANTIRQMIDKLPVGGSCFFDKSAHKVRTVQFICGQMKKKTGKVFATETRSKLTAVTRIK